MKSAIKILPVLLCFVSCTDIRHAQGIVAEADSLRTAGAVYDDSLRLDSAYTTLGCWWNRNIYPDDYARACYYYGKLLRNRGNQVEAMRCFIAGSYADSFYGLFPLPWFNDYIILGRIYSNMGTMCHEVEEFQLSCEMYEKSSEQFLAAGDSTMYYYSLNNIAFELAAQKKAEEAHHLLDRIRQESSDITILSKTLETEAFLLRMIEKYDSAIIIVNRFQQLGNTEPTGYIIKAQSFWYLEQYDSALYYARYSIENLPLSDYNRSNMLYILAYNDTTINRETANQLSEERTDLQIEKITQQKQQLSIAVERLRQSFNKSRYYIYFLLLILFLFMLGFLLWYASYKISATNSQADTIIKQAKDSLSSITDEEKRLSVMHVERESLLIENEQIQHNINELQHKTVEMQIRLSNYNKQLEEQQKKRLCEIENLCNLIRHSQNWKREIHWDNFDELCEYINTQFSLLANKLKATEFIDEKRMRLCILVLLDIPKSNDELADIIIYSRNGIGKYKYRLSQKFNIETKDLRDYLLKMVISESKISSIL